MTINLRCKRTSELPRFSMLENLAGKLALVELSEDEAALYTEGDRIQIDDDGEPKADSPVWRIVMLERQEIGSLAYCVLDQQPPQRNMLLV